MKLSVFLDYASGPERMTQMVLAAEAAEADMVWVPEAYGFDAASFLGYLAAKTDRIGLASGIFPVYSRSAALIGMTATGLDALSGGRFTLGVGSSGPQVIEGFHGATFDRPLARTRDVVEVVRKIVRREPVEHHGPTLQLPLPEGQGRPMRLLNRPVRDKVPIAVAAIGEKNVELAAEIADVWLPMFGFFHPGHWDQVWAKSLAEGGHKRSADLAPLEVAAGAPVGIGPDADAARESFRDTLALYVGGMGSREANFYNELFRRYGYGDDAAQIQDNFLGGKRDEARAAVPEQYLDEVGLFGTEAQIEARVEEYRVAGVTNLVTYPVGDDPEGTLRTLRELTR